jgi:hypothetical protein
MSHSMVRVKVGGVPVGQLVAGVAGGVPGARELGLERLLHHRFLLLGRAVGLVA